MVTFDDDGALLKRFVATREEAPFEELVRRHGAFVFGVCCRVLGRTQDAEDATQAVFLTLANKAAAVQGYRSVAAWLHKTAWTVSLYARRSTDNRKRREREAGMLSEARCDDEVESGDWAQLKPLLDEELQALPEKYRLPLILHHVEGHSQEEIATLLSWTYGTVSGRLSRAREMLRERLARRGVTVAPALLFLLISRHAPVAMPPALFVSTTSAAASLAAGDAPISGAFSTRAKTLSEGATRTMFIAKLKFAAGIALAAGVLVSGVAAVVSAHAADGAQKALPQAAQAAPPQPVAGNESPAPKPAAPALVAAAAPKIDGWIAQLGSPDAETRMAAMDGLRNAGAAAQAALKAAAATSTGEARDRAVALLGALDNAALLQKMAEAMKNITTYEADMLVARSMGGAAIDGSGHVKAEPAKSRFIIDGELNMGGMTMKQHEVCDGATVWNEVTEPAPGAAMRKTVIKRTYVPGKEGHEEEGREYNFTIHLKQFDFVEAHEQTLDGVACYVLNGVVREDYLDAERKLLTPEALAMGNQYTVRSTCIACVGRDDLLLRKFETKDDNGNLIESTKFQNIKVNAKFDDALFVYCPPPGASVVDGDEKKAAEASAPVPAENKEPAKPKDF